MKIRPVVAEFYLWTDEDDKAKGRFSQFCERA